MKKNSKEKLLRKMKKLEKKYEKCHERAIILKQRLKRKAANLIKVIERM